TFLSYLLNILHIGNICFHSLKIIAMKQSVRSIHHSFFSIQQKAPAERFNQGFGLFLFIDYAFLRSYPGPAG
ncbi:hypothetical protein LH384_34745, partial [Pseudomonas aeruginosa]|nr:hypothetical protein [Pseudomonas aeruginosa]